MSAPKNLNLEVVGDRRQALSITLHASPKTDLWRKPGSNPIDSNNAPHLLESVPVNSFSYAQVTVEAPWTRLYDQGGLVIFPPSSSKHPPWIKTGIEFYGGIPNLSTVSTQTTASDWSLLPLKENKATIRVERETQKDGSKGPTLWIYLIDGGKKVSVREVTWVFADEAHQTEEFQIGVYCARPTAEEGDSGRTGDDLLEVVFKDLIVHTDPPTL